MTTLDREEVVETLDEVLSAFELFTDKVDWGKAFLDAETIRRTNNAFVHGNFVLREEGKR